LLHNYVYVASSHGEEGEGYAHCRGITRRQIVRQNPVGELPSVAGVEAISPRNDALKLSLAPGTVPQDVVQALLAAQVTVERFEIAMPSMDEVFIRVVQEGGA